MENISFFSEDVEFQLEDENKINHWISAIARQEKHTIEEVNYIFCSDEYLLELNRKYLGHDYYTDIITFNNSESPTHIVSDLFISTDRVKENASDFGIGFHQELYRVMIHGLLHLMGYNDKQEDEQILMRKKEDACLSLLNKNSSTWNT